MNATLEHDSGRPVLRFERRLGHPPEKVWGALTESAQISRWFPADIEGDFEVGSRLRFPFREDEGPTQDGEVLEVDPPRELAYTWGGAVLRFELRPDGEGCVLVFTHEFDERDEAPKFAAGWHVCLDGLEALLDGDRHSFSQERWQELHDGYAGSLG
jgi:uncharacterized protein YndB with AHSA1/START domain